MLDALVFIVVAFLLTAAGRQLVAFSYPPAVAEPPATPLPQKEGGEEHTPSAPPSLRGPASERGKGDGGVGLRLTTLERNLLGFGLGLGLFGYVILGMLLLGSVGHHLRPGFSFLVLLPFLGLQTSQWPAMWRELRQTKLPRLTPAGWGAALVFALFATTALVGVYSPPTQLEWDALAYHLADPKLFIAQGRIVPLPWESHSEFAFNTEMWYTFGLLNGGIPLAKLFHFACGAGAALTIYAFGRRFFSHAVGVVGALIFVSTPLVFWEAGAAYADLATTYFTALTGLAVALWLAFPQRPPRSPKFGGRKPQNAGTVSHAPFDAAAKQEPVPEISSPQTWGAGGAFSFMLLPAALMGLTLATKATALTTLGLLALVILVTIARRTNWPRALSTATLWAALALLIGCPYFVKSAVRTGNPIYPFYFQIFGGRNWSLDRAQAYDASNAAFGQGRRPLDFLLLPYNLTMSLVPNHPLPARNDAPVKQSFNDQQNILWTLSPVLLASLFFPIFGAKRGPPLLKPLALYALGAVTLWFLTAQHVRYLLPTLPALCLLSAWAVVEAWNGKSLSGRTLAAFGAVFVLFSLGIAGLLLTAQGPVALGLQSKNSYLTANVPDYAAMQFLNTQTPKTAKIVFYGNPFGFYCNRAYFWGDRQHSAFVPYDTFHAPADFLRWLKGQGVTHVLISRRYFQPVPGGGDTGAVNGFLPLCGPPVYDARGLEIYRLP